MCQKFTKMENSAVCKGDYCKLSRLEGHEYAHLAFLWKSSVLLRRGNLIFHHFVIGSCVFLSGSQLGLRVSEG